MRRRNARAGRRDTPGMTLSRVALVALAVVVTALATPLVGLTVLVLAAGITRAAEAALE